MKKRHLRNEKGAAIVEFAIVVVLLLATIFGIIEFGILMYDQHVLTNASREGARSGVVMRNPRVYNAAIINKVNQYAQQNMISFDSSSTLTTTITPAESSRTGQIFGIELAVKVTYTYDFLVLSGLGVGPITLEAETRMRME